MGKTKRFISKILCLVLSLVLFLQGSALTTVFANTIETQELEYTINLDGEDDVLDLTDLVYGLDNIISPEEVEAIRAAAEENEPLFDIITLNSENAIARWAFANNAAINTGGFLTADGRGINSNGGGAAILEFIVEGEAEPRVLTGVSSAINVRNAGGNSDGGLNNQANNAWWQTTISTLGLAEIDVEWQMRSTNTGPRDFRLEYSLDGTTWHGVSDFFLSNNAGANPAIGFPDNNFTRRLPAGAENEAVVYIRWIITSNTSVNLSQIAAGGTHQINNIEITANDTTDTTPTFQRISEAHKLPNNTSQTITVQGLVVGRGMNLGGTNYDNANIYIQDGIGKNDGILVWSQNSNLSSYVGQWVEVTGLVTPMGGGTHYRNQIQIGPNANPVGTIEVVDRNNRPTSFPAVPATIDDLVAGDFLGMRVKLEFVEFGHNDNRASFLAASANQDAAPGRSHFVIAGGERIELRPEISGNLDSLAHEQIITVEAFVGWQNNRSAVQLLHAEVDTTVPAVFPVTANPSSGSTLPETGGTVILSTLTAGATINYRVNNGSWQTAATPATITVSSFVSGTATIEAYASFGGDDSATRTFTYTQQTGAMTVREARLAPIGDVVTVRGIVTNIYETAANNNNSFFLQDPNGTCELSGIHIRLVSANTPIDVADPDGARAFVGHLVEVTGVRQRPTATNGFQGVDNIMTAGVGHGVTIITENVTLPAVVPVQLADLTANSGDSRPYSSMMVSVERAMLHENVQTGTRNSALRNPDNNLALTIDGNTFIVNPLPTGLQAGDWVTINRANVHWWAGRSEVQLRLIDPAIDIELAPAPLLTPVVANPESGLTVALGGTVTLSASPEEARIVYSVNGDFSITSTSNSVDVFVDSFPSGSFVIEAHSVLPDGGGGYLETTTSRTFTYTQAQVADVVPSHVSGRVRPDTLIVLQTATQAADIFYNLTRNVGAGNEHTYTEALYDNGIVLTENMFPVRIEAVARATGFIDSNTITLDYELRVVGGEQIFFGQLHAHSTLSDGQGTPEAAFAEARDVAQLDFFALTDHSNWFDAGFVSGNSGTRATNADGPDVFNLREYQRFGSPQWERGNQAAQDATTPSFLGINAFEFTWSGGPGHINTFNTTGWVGRQNTFLNNANHDLRLQRYYDLLRNTPESISMFNHPGTTFGNFNNFAHFDPEVALRIPLIEVTNGEGAVGAGGFFPAYEQFTMALDRGWLLAPVSSQDNHRGRFGWANEGRVAMYTNDFSFEGMWQAFRDRAVYSTEIRDMEIRFSVNNQPMGSIIHNVPSVAEFSASVYIPEIPRNDGSTSRERDTYTIRRISLITNGGVERHVQNFNTPVGETAQYNVTMNDPQPGYYYLWVVAENSRGQQRVGVTAPVWIGRAPIVGITDVSTDTFMPVTTEALTLNTRLFNDESDPVKLVSLQYIVNDVVIDTVVHDMMINPTSSVVLPFTYTPQNPGIDRIMVRAIMEVSGTYRTFDGFLDITVRDIDTVRFIGIDAAHFNEYVDGNYRDSFSNFARVASTHNLITEVLRTEQDILNAANNPRFAMLLISSPGRHNNIINDPSRGEHRSFSQAVVDAVADFAQRGGTVAIAGFGNFNDSGGRISGVEGAASFQLNRILAAMESNIRVGDSSHDAPVGFRETAAAHQHLLRFRNNFNLNNPFMQGIVPYEDDLGGNGQLYRNFSTGVLYVVDDATVEITDQAGVDANVVRGAVDLYADFGVDVMVLAHPASHTVDSNTNQGSGRIKFPTPGANFPRYEHPDLGLLPAPPQGTGAGERPAAGGRDDGQHLMAASQQVGDGTVLVFASNFFSNFDVQAELDFYGQLPNANFTISDNIFRSLAPPVVITDIVDVLAAPQGEWVTIEGIVTTGLQIVGSGSSENRGFMNSIYIQDSTGGINLFEVTEGNAAGLQVGNKVRAHGFVSQYQGETQLTVHLGGSFSIIDTSVTIVSPLDMTVAEANNPLNTGWLASVSGVVSDVIMQPGTNDTVLQFTITQNGVSIPVYMRDYITPGVDLSFVSDGVTVSVIGLVSIGELAYGTGSRIRVRDRNEIQLISNPSLTLNPANISINDNNLTAISNVLGTATGAITLTHDLPSGLNVQIIGSSVVVSGARPTFNQPAIDGTFTIDVTRGGLTETLTVSVNLTPVEQSVQDPETHPDQDNDRDLGNVGTEPTPPPAQPEPETPPAPPEATQRFIDVVASDWFYDSVNIVAERGVFRGTGENIFSPQISMTRAMFVQALANLEGVDLAEFANGNPTFTDTSRNSWYFSAIEWAFAEGLISGMGDGTFAPDEAITREQMATMLFRFVRLRGIILGNSTTETFADYTLISDWAQESVMSMQAAGIIFGRPGNVFDPRAVATRAEVAAIFARLLEAM